MIICPVCGKELMDTAKFCASCGSPVAVNIPTKKICQVCGQEIAEGAKFCGTCGTPVPQDYGFGPGSGPQKQKKPFPKKIFLFAGIGVAAVAVLAVVVIFVLNYIRSSRGRATIAVREDEIATESLGINTTKMKVAAFVIGAMAAAVAGSVHATNLGVINPSQFGFDRSIDVLITVVFGGIGSITGSIVAGFILGILNLYLQQFGALRMIIYAIALIGIMIFKPSGLLGGREFSLSTLLGREEDRPGFIKSLKKKD